MIMGAISAARWAFLYGKINVIASRWTLMPTASSAWVLLSHRNLLRDR